MYDLLATPEQGRQALILLALCKLESACWTLSASNRSNLVPYPQAQQMAYTEDYMISCPPSHMNRAPHPDFDLHQNHDQHLPKL